MFLKPRFNAVSFPYIVGWTNNGPFPGMSLKLPPSASELLDARKEYDVTLQLYHDPWTCPMRDISLEIIKKAKIQTHKYRHLNLSRHETHWAEPERISNEPGMHHGSCWRIHVDTPQKLTPELKELMEVRLTDAQARALLRAQELVYEVLEEKKWVTHTFEVIIREKYVKEAKESKHIKNLLKDLTGKKDVASVYRGIPDKWIPYVLLYSSHVIIGLMDKENRDITIENKLYECNVALRVRSEVFTLLKHEMEEFLESEGIPSDRRLNAAIRTEIEVILDDFGIVEDHAKVKYVGANIDSDSTGGDVLYVTVATEHSTHPIPITGHIHDIRVGDSCIKPPQT